MELVWAKHMSVGNATIDAEHKNLIVVANSMVHAAGMANYDALIKGFALFETYIHLHFRNEEMITDAIRLHFPRNKKEHLHFLNEMQQMIGNKIIKNGSLSVESLSKYSHFLIGWIGDHIYMDTQMKPVLQAYPYDFKPG